VSNTASITSDTADPNATNNSATTETTLEAQADLVLDMTGPATATAGDNATYTLTVSNNGPSLAENVVLEENFPTGLSLDTATSPCAGGFPCNLGSLDVGDSVSIDVTFDIGSQLQGVIQNAASVSSDTIDPANGNDSDSVSTAVESVANLSLEKTAETEIATAGQLLIYTILVHNDGPSQAANVIVTDNLPGGQSLVATNGCAEDPAGAPTCTISSLASGESASVSIQVRVGEVAENTTSTNTATVTSDASDPVSADNNSAAGVQLIRTLPVPALSRMTLLLLITATLIAGLAASRIKS
jgi:uncharacterized repeat protein (TIGR01451 family)